MLFPVILDFENHPNCPNCDSSNTKLRVYNNQNNTDYLHRPQSCPQCNDCGHYGMLGFQSNYWVCTLFNGNIYYLHEELREVIKENSSDLIDDETLELIKDYITNSPISRKNLMGIKYDTEKNCYICRTYKKLVQDTKDYYISPRMLDEFKTSKNL